SVHIGVGLYSVAPRRRRSRRKGDGVRTGLGSTNRRRTPPPTWGSQAAREVLLGPKTRSRNKVKPDRASANAATLQTGLSKSRIKMTWKGARAPHDVGVALG